MPDVLDAVRSVRDQSLPPLEILVVDDGSSDGTGGAVERAFAGAAASGCDAAAEVRVIRGTFGSAAAARKAGWRAARAPWVGFLDADDLWFDGKLATAARVLEAAPQAAWF